MIGRISGGEDDGGLGVQLGEYCMHEDASAADEMKSRMAQERCSRFSCNTPEIDGLRSGDVRYAVQASTWKTFQERGIGAEAPEKKNFKGGGE